LERLTEAELQAKLA